MTAIPDVPSQLSSTSDNDRPVRWDADVWVAGVDGCRGGWFVVRHPRDAPERAESVLFRTFADILDASPRLDVIAIDIPIGLPDCGTRGGRPADIETRAKLGARQSAVFAVPARATLACTDYPTACAIALEHSSPPRKMSKQIFQLFPKVREVDDLMSPELQSRVFEAHPEAAFWQLNGQNPLDLPKKVKSRPFAEGLEVRKKLLSAVGYPHRLFDIADIRRTDAGLDDLLDACANAHTATRIARGVAERAPAEPTRDARGLRMEIWR